MIEARGSAATRLRLSLPAILMVIGFAAMLQLLCTIRGGLFEDTAVAWDEALRLYAGQLPYRDFAGASGPLAGFVAWIFLVLSGGHLGVAIVFLSVCANVAAAFLVQWLVWRATADIILSVVAGLFTGGWYLTMLGGWYYDHAAYLCVLGAAALWLLDAPIYSKHIAIGVLLGLSFWFKQTTGTFASVAFGLAYLSDVPFSALRRGPFWAMVAAAACAFGAILAVLLMVSDHELLLKYFVTLPAAYSNATKDYSRLFIMFVTPYFLNPIAAIRGHHLGDLNMYLMVLLIYASYAVVLWRRHMLRERSPLRFALVFLFVSTFLCVPMVGRLLTHLIWGLGGIFAIVVFLAFPEDARLRARAGFAVLLYSLLFWAPHIWVDRLQRPGVDVAAGWSSAIWPVSINSGRFAYDRPGQALALADIARRLKDTDCHFALYDDSARLVALLAGRAPENLVIAPQEIIAVPIDPQGRAAWEREEIMHLKARRTDVVIVTFESVTRRFRVEHSTPLGFESLQIFQDFFDTDYRRVAMPDGIDVYVLPDSPCAMRLASNPG